MLLAIGMFVFEVPNLLFDQLKRRRNWRHPTSERVGARAASQFAGVGEDTLTLSGVLAPGVMGRKDALEDLAAMADQGRSWPVLDGDGFVYGAFVILDLDETKRELLENGQATLIDFTVNLQRVDDDEGDTSATGSEVRA
ncbi:MAG: phage tail protein [Brevundimonas aurantiaca]|jgi:phage protein U|uniref:phage tail protein n=1 Tax=Brevundimonas aurantiaca TaxID=74316 RepID=UPI0040346D31